MANIAKALKVEIARISGKEIKAAVGEVTRGNKTLKKTIAGLKKRIANLEKENKRLSAAVKRSEGQAKQAITTEKTKRARLTSKGIRALRKKLKLTRPAFAKLLGTSPQSVYMWETKNGPLKLRVNTKAAILSLRGIGAREAKRRLGEDQEEAR